MTLSAASLGAAGLLALAALPVAAHLARQEPRERVAFGAMLLLERVVRRLRRQRRIQDPWLLLLRLLAVAGWVVAAVDPQVGLPGAPAALGRSGRVVLVVDRSLSMSQVDAGTTALERARGEALAALDALPPGTQVGLVTFSDVAEPLTPALTADLNRVRAQLADLSPTYGRSDLRAGLLEARRLLAGEPGEVVLLSDEAGPRIVSDATGEVERLVAGGSAILPRPVRAATPRNVAVDAAAWREGIEGGQVALQLRNYGPTPLEVSCEVSLPDERMIPLFVEVPANGSAEEAVTVPADVSGGVGRVRCADPDLPADDARWFHLPSAGASRVLVIDGDPGETPTRSEVYFLERALAPWGGGRAQVAIDVATPAALATLDPAVHRVVFLANLADPRPFGPALAAFVRAGGGLIVSGGDNVTSDWYNAALGEILPSPLRRARALGAGGPDDPGLPLQLPDLTLSLSARRDGPAAETGWLAPFARGGRGGFARVHARTALTFEPFAESDEVQTLLRWEGGLPALVVRRVGEGRVLVWTSTLDLGWTDFPLQAVYMPTLQRLVEVLGASAGGAAARWDAVVGDAVAVALPDGTTDAVVLDPDGAPVRARIGAAQVLFQPTLPGAYRVESAASVLLAWVAVNTAPEESDVRSVESVAAVEQALKPELLRRFVHLGPVGLAVGVAALVGSAWLAARRRAAKEVG